MGFYIGIGAAIGNMGVGIGVGVTLKMQQNG
jgi:hypothetical protein